METFKTILRIVFGTASVLGGLFAINNFFNGPAVVIGLILMYVNLVDLPLVIVFVFVLLYQWLFKKQRVSFFKTELIYLLIQICAFVLISLSYVVCKTCVG